MHDIAEYILILIYISIIKKDDMKVLYRIYKEIHFVNNLKIYMLLSNDVINSKKIILDIAQSKIYIDSYEVIAVVISR